MNARLLPLVAVACFASACTRSETAVPVVRVDAAASLTDVVTELAAQYPSARVLASFGGSGALARQIRDGAPADVFLSASRGWIEFLREGDALAGEPILLAGNHLVAVAPRGSSLAAADPGALLDRLDGAARVAIADEGVPAGEYARDALDHLGLLDGYSPHLVGLSDVRAVLHAVELGETAVGFVYSTDAAVADVEVLFTFDPATYPAIEYQAAAVRGAPNEEEGLRFVDFLQSESARSILAAAGFVLP